MAAQRQGVQVLANPLRVEENRYQLDFNLMKNSSKPTVQRCGSSARHITRPAGSGAREEIRQVSDLCQRYGTILVVDELRAEHILDGKFASCLTSGCTHPGQPDRAHHRPTKRSIWAG